MAGAIPQHAKIYDQWSTCRARVRSRGSQSIIQLGGETGRASDSDIVSGTVGKDIHQPASGWNLMLKPSQDYLDNLHNNDWIEIFMDIGDGTGERRVMYGLIDKVQRVKTVDGKGGEQWAIQVGGRDWGKILLGTELIFDTQLAGLSLMPLSFVQWSKTHPNLSSTPGAALSYFLNVFMGQSKQFLAPGLTLSGQNPSNLLDTSRIFNGFSNIIIPDQSNFSGILWNLLETYAVGFLHEMFTDWNDDPTVDIKPLQFVYRINPYDKTRFQNLGEADPTKNIYGTPPISLDSTEVGPENLAKSEYDIRNWFRVFVDAPGSSVGDITTAEVLGYLNPESILQNGLKRMESTTNGLWPFSNGAPAKTDSVPWNTLIDQASQMLAEWYGFQDDMLSGSFTCRFRPDVKVGRRLNYQNSYTGERLAFYIEAYNHTFSYSETSSSMTEIEVSRGVPSDPLGLVSFSDAIANGQLISLKNANAQNLFKGNGPTGIQTVPQGSVISANTEEAA